MRIIHSLFIKLGSVRVSNTPLTVNKITLIVNMKSLPPNFFIVREFAETVTYYKMLFDGVE